MKFEWDPRKASSNLRKHGGSFDEAMTVFADRHPSRSPILIIPKRKERFTIVGVSSRGRISVVCHGERDENVRIISARRADARERKKYGR